MSPAGDAQSETPRGGGNENAAAGLLAPYAPVGAAKFFAMSLLTLTIYDVYWLYRNWQRIRARTGDDVSPFWRAFLAPIWAFSLFERIRRDALAHGIDVSWNTGVLGAAYLILSLAWLLPTPWLLASFVAFAPLIPVANTARALNARSGAAEDANDAYSAGNIAGMAVGGVVLIALVAATLMGY